MSMTEMLYKKRIMYTLSIRQKMSILHIIPTGYMLGNKGMTCLMGSMHYSYTMGMLCATLLLCMNYIMHNLHMAEN